MTRSIAVTKRQIIILLDQSSSEIVLIATREDQLGLALRAIKLLEAKVYEN